MNLQPRMPNPAQLLDGVTKGIFAIMGAAQQTDVPQSTLELVHLRASQINGCSACVDAGTRTATKNGVSAEKLNTVAAWREAPYFTDAERAALALAEGMTRLADRPDAVSDELWSQVVEHYDEKQRAALIVYIATTNLFNRLNATTRQIAGAWG